MAVIKAINSKSSVKSIVEYVADKNKTNECLMYGKDCSSEPQEAIEDMKMTKELYSKTDGRQYKHFVQSFNPKDKLTPEKALEIGKEWAEKNFKGYEVFMATHIDKNHIHTHFIVNTVNFETAEKYRQSRADLERYKEISNKICEREGLAPTEPNKTTLTSFDSNKYKALEKGVEGNYKSYMLELFKNINRYMKSSTSKEQFISLMNNKGYKVNWSDTRKNITYITPENKRIRDSNLAKTFKNDKFNKEGLLNEFNRNREGLGREEKASHFRTINGGSSTRNKELNIGIRGFSTEGNRHTESSSIKFSRCDEVIQGTDREEQRNDNTEVQRNGGSIKQSNSNDTGRLLETTTGGAKESTRNNEIKQDRNNIRNERNDRKISSEDRASIFTENSSSIFNSRFKSSLPTNIQDGTELDKEILKQINQNKSEVNKNLKSDEEKINNKVKYEDRER